MKADLEVVSERVALPDGVRPGKIRIKGEKILSVEPPGGPTESEQRLDVGRLAVLPGLVDTHVHLNEPGRAEWEGFETGTRAALSGGVTTVVDMPLNCIPVTTTRSALELKKRAARGRFYTDYGFWGGVVPGNAGELEAMAEAGALGFKCFLVDSGIPEFPASTEADLRQAMPVLRRLGLPLLVHAELDCGCGPLKGSARSYKRYLASRPKRWENEAVALVAKLCLELGCRVHIVHLSSAEALPTIAKARAAGAPLTVETCPHYLVFHAEAISAGRTEFKCAPPIRERKNAAALWKALGAGRIDFVVSDHSPCAPELKRQGGGDFMKAWGGIASVQLAPASVWTEAARRKFGLERLPGWLADGPARFAGLAGKGRLAPGADADLVVFDPEAAGPVRPQDLRHRHKLTPYLGRRLRGRVERAFLRGREVYARGRFAEPQGRFLTRRTPQ